MPVSGNMTFKILFLMMQPLLKKSVCVNVILIPALPAQRPFRKSVILFLFVLLLVNAIQAQSLTISSGGQTGTSGTNWSITGTNPVTLTATGNANVNTSVIQGYLNAGTSVILNNTNVGTTINSDISKTGGGNASLTVKDIGNVKIAANISSSSNMLDIILWADDDNSQGGTVDDFMYLSPGITLNSNGGKIILAGGPDNGTNGGVSGDGIPDGFAWNGSNSATYGADQVGGLTLGPRGGTGTVISIQSNGGEIILRGSTSNNNGYPGITSQGNLKIESGTGKIAMYGKSTLGHGIELTFGAAPTIAISSSSTTIPAIDIKGTTTASGYMGFWASNNGIGNMLIQSAAASGGGITIEGTSSTGNGLMLGNSGTNIISQVLSQSGTITLKGKGTSNSSILLYGDSYIGNRKDANSVQGITPSVTASTANILLQGDDQLKFGNTSAKNTNINSTGSLTIEAYSAGYSGTVSWLGNTSIGSGFNSITLGESAENYSVTLNNSLTAAGNITAYTSDFVLADGIGLASSVAGTITINARGNFGTAGTTRRTISTVNGNININADADASGNGQLDIDYLTMNPGTGNTTVRCETMNWLTTVNTDKPYFNGTGTVTIEPADASFQDVFTQWFNFDQDANGIGGLTIGKATNTGNVTHQTNALTIAGPIAFYGGIVQLDVNLTSSANGDIFLKANTNRNLENGIDANASVFKTAGTGTLTMQGFARINSGTITASGSGVLNVVLWSDYGNSNNGGVEVNAITTNGGQLWIGGSNTTGGTYTWKGLNVGDGPSVGSVNNNYNAIDFYGPVATGGGDVLIWGGSGYAGGTSGLAIMATGRSINVGSGNITIIADKIEGNDITLTSTGILSLVPDGGSYPAAITWSGSATAGNFNATGTFDPLIINNFANLGGLTLGYFNGQLSSGIPVLQANSSDITGSTAISIAGSILLYGNALTVNQNLASTAAGNISLFTNGVTIAGAVILSSTGNLVIEPVTAGSTIGLASTGTISLTTTNFTTNFADGFSEIRIGNSAAGNIKLGAAITLRDNLRLITASNLLLNEMLDIGSNNVRFAGNTITPAVGKFIKTNGTGKLYIDIANNSAKLLPIGITYYNPVTVTNHTGSSDTFYATVSNNIFMEGTTSGTAVIWNPRINLTWNIGNNAATTGAGNVDLVFGWNAANESATFTTPRLLHHDGSSWQLLTGIPAADLVAKTVTFTGYTGSFSPFAISENNVLLPVGWLSFTAVKNQNTVKLTWSTASEKNNVYFEVQRSADGASFTDIGRVSSVQQNSSNTNEYNFTDYGPLAGKSYYRLRQVDIDGKSSYSKIISISTNSDGGYDVEAMSGSRQIQVLVPQNVAGKIVLTIHDAGGRQVLLQQVKPGHSVIHTNSLISGGIYFVNIIEGNKQVYTGRFVQ